ncbi:hypothetical protein, partial [Paraburkholderia sp. SIMBA_027]
WCPGDAQETVRNFLGGYEKRPNESEVLGLSQTVPGCGVKNGKEQEEAVALANETLPAQDKTQASKSAGGFVKYRYGARSAAGRMTA